MASSFDAIIIGTGQAGPPLAIRLAKAGRSVAIIERGLFGGTCVNTGCIPTKAMVASAYAALTARRGPEYGVILPGEVRVDMKKVKDRKDAILAPSRAGVENGLRSAKNCTVFTGQARFESAHEVSVGSERLTAAANLHQRRWARRHPQTSRHRGVPFLTNSSMMHVDFLPRHLAIVGGSYIGLEFGQMFRRFGSEVTIIEMAPRLSPEKTRMFPLAIQEILQNEGVQSAP